MSNIKFIVICHCLLTTQQFTMMQFKMKNTIFYTILLQVKQPQIKKTQNKTT